jgi:hypothetical protein
MSSPDALALKDPEALYLDWENPTGPPRTWT